MNESFLQFIWQQQLFEKENLETVDNRKIEILNPGFKNTNSGPDFYDAKIRVGEQLWAGTVEIHLRASDWYNHNHSNDKAYDNVILHIVADYDTDIFNSKGVKIPTFVLNYSKNLYKNYTKLIMNKGPIPCSDFLHTIDEFYIKTWINRLLVQRFQRKTKQVFDSYIENQKSWEETFYQFIAKNFGFKVNALPFEILAKSLPYKFIAKQKDDLSQIEALLFGQAGFLKLNCDDDYFLKLKRDYEFFSKKYNLKPLKMHLWKFLRLRPVNFPTVRIAQLAALLHKNVNMFSKILEAKNIKQIFDYFDVKVSDYWLYHYKFCKTSKKSYKKLGKISINGFLINSIAVFLFAYGQNQRNEEYKEKAFDLLENIPSEKNNIIDKWKTTVIKPQNAFDTQALIELYNQYCKKGRCLDCNLGGKIIIKEKII